MKRLSPILITLLTTLMAGPTFAGVKVIDNTNAVVGVFDILKCASGFSCTQSAGGQFTIGQQANSRTIMIPLYGAKVGGTAGWVVNAATNALLATIPASQTASILIVPLPPMRVGSVITGFALEGFIASAGNSGTFDADLRSQTAAAGSITDASVTTMTQLAVTANTAVTAANASKSGLTTTVVEGVTYYLKITATTGVSVTAAISGVELVSTAL